jgi:putative SOS response-associated peptidase YedK
MPVILRRDDYELWLDPTFRDAVLVSDMLRPFDARKMRRYQVSARVNNVRNDDADCAKPVEPEASPTQAQLF